MEAYPDYVVNHCGSFKELLLMTIKTFPESILFEHNSRRLSYSQFVADVLRVYHNLVRYKEKYILIDVQQTNDFATAFFATVLSGNIAVLHNANLNVLESPFQNLDFSCKIDRQYLTDLLDAFKANEENIVQITSIENIIHQLQILPDVLPNKTCAILCSSGTTSVQKGICLSQTSLCFCTEGGMQKLLYPFGSKYISLLPMHHAFGLVADLLGCMYSGGTLCLLDSPVQFFSALTKYNPDKLNVPPAIATQLGNMILRSGKLVAGTSLKTILCAGAPLDTKTIKVLRNHGINALSAYGQTECSPCISMSRDQQYKDGSAGLILSGLNVQIASDGEILVNGPGVMNGYLNDEEATNSVIVDGWLHTSDLGYIDDDGFLYVTGRKNNLAIFSDGTKCTIESVEKTVCDLEFVEECLAFQNGDTWEITIYPTSLPISSTEKRSLYEVVATSTNHVVTALHISANPLPRNSAGKLIR